MIHEVKTYFCDNIPGDEDIEQALAFARSGICWVKLCWFVHYSALYSVYVKPESTVDSVKAQMPKVYGV